MGVEMIFVLGNVASLVGCVIMVAIGFLKKKEHILAAQCVQFGFLGMGNLALGAISGFISGVVSIIRNLVFFRAKSTVWLKLLFIAIQVALTLAFGMGSWMDWLPVLAGVLFTWFVDAKRAATFKLAIIAAQSMWLVYDLYYRNYVASAFDVMTMISNLIGFFMVRNQK